MKTMIDLNDEDLALAAKELGTTTKKDTVNAAPSFVASRRRRIEQLINDPYALGVGPDITNPEVMDKARRWTIPVSPGQLYLIDTSAHRRTLTTPAVRNVIAGLIADRVAATCADHRPGSRLLRTRRP